MRKWTMQKQRFPNTSMQSGISQCRKENMLPASAITTSTFQNPLVLINKS
jgi:hypothetical protein